MMDINVYLLQWFINFLKKKFQVEQLKMKIFLIKKDLKNDTNQILENSRKEKYTQLSQTIFGGTDLADMQLISTFW